MTFFLDEAVRESMQPAGGAVFNLLGAVDGRQTFENAKRFDGTDVETGDTTIVACVQNVGGAVVRAVAKATLTLGGTNTLTLNTTAYPAGTMYFSTEGASFPGFNTGDTGEVFCTMAVPNAAIIDPDGNLLQSQQFRQTMFPSTLTAFLAQVAAADNEAVLALIRNGDNYSGLAGIFAQNTVSTGTADAVDKFTNPNVSGKVDRVSLKVAPTYRELTIGAGGVLDISTFCKWFNLADPKARFFINAWDNAAPSTFLKGYWHGHATTPIAFGIDQHAAPPLLKFDIVGTALRLKNATGAEKTYSAVVERIG